MYTIIINFIPHGCIGNIWPNSNVFACMHVHVVTFLGTPSFLLSHPPPPLHSSPLLAESSTPPGAGPVQVRPCPCVLAYPLSSSHGWGWCPLHHGAAPGGRCLLLPPVLQPACTHGSPHTHRQDNTLTQNSLFPMITSYY